MCHNYTNEIISDPTKCLQGIPVLMQAIENVRSVPTQLTPIHADLCQISLKAKCFNRALKYLNADITEIATAEVSVVTVPLIRCSPAKNIYF